MTIVTDPAPIQRLSEERLEIGSPLAGFLSRILERHGSEAGGSVATYIPELGRADPAWFGIAAATLDGTVHGVGDAHIPFTIQSISKPLTYALVLDDLGEAAVRARIGVEPTGDAFNAITLDRVTGRPLNPMVNAGAIAAAGLVKPNGSATALDRLLEGYGRFAGHPVRINPEVQGSERMTGHRNRAIGHLLRASGALDADVDEAVDRYFAQCSVEATAADLAVIAATLANGGVNPVTGERAASAETVRSVLAVMATCGMYDGAGEWLYAVGLPAKSGVSGGILAVVPGRMGLGFYSPPVDAQGNSVRGGLACRDIVRELDLHPLGHSRPESNPLRCRFTVAEVASKRRRSPEARAALAAGGRRALVLEMQGHLTFLAVESIAAAIRAASSDGEPLESLILDLRRVSRFEPAAVGLLASALRSVEIGGGRVLLSGAHHHAQAIGKLEAELTDARLHADLDGALEEAEDTVLERVAHPRNESVAAHAHPILAALDARDRRALIAAATIRAYPAGTTIVTAGDSSDELFLILDGRLSVTVPANEGHARRLSTLDAGMVFGETALLGDARRTADVVADGPVTCLVLSRAAFESVGKERPAAAIAVLRQLLGTATATTARLTREIAVRAG